MFHFRGPTKSYDSSENPQPTEMDESNNETPALYFVNQLEYTDTPSTRTIGQHSDIDLLASKELPLSDKNRISKSPGMSIPQITENGLPESWLEVKKSDIEFSNDVGSSISHTNTNGILSSSDTSEEDMESQSSQANPTLEFQSNLELTKCTQENLVINFDMKHNRETNPITGGFGSHSLLDIQPISVDDRNRLSSIGFTDINEADSVTITKSMSESTNSFMMPKLTKDMNAEDNEGTAENELKILVLGRMGLQFWKQIPAPLRKFFFIPRTLDTKMYNCCYGIIVVIEEANELMNVLNKVSGKVKTTVPITTLTADSDNIIQIRNITNSYTKRGIITQMYPSFVSSDKEEETKFLFFISSVAKLFKQQQEQVKSVLEGEYQHESSQQSLATSGQFSRSCQSCPSHKHLLSHDHARNRELGPGCTTDNKGNGLCGESKSWPQTTIMTNKWFIFGISFSIGFGIGYSLSYLTNDELLTTSIDYIYRLTKGNPPEIIDPTPPVYFPKLNKIATQFRKIIQLDLQSKIASCVEMVSQSLRKFGLQLRTGFINSVNFLEAIQMATQPRTDLPKGNISDDQGKILSLGYILI